MPYSETRRIRLTELLRLLPTNEDRTELSMIFKEIKKDALNVKDEQIEKLEEKIEKLEDKNSDLAAEIFRLEEDNALQEAHLAQCQKIIDTLKDMKR